MQNFDETVCIAFSPLLISQVLLGCFESLPAAAVKSAPQYSVLCFARKDWQSWPQVEACGGGGSEQPRFLQGLNNLNRRRIEACKPPQLLRGNLSWAYVRHRFYSVPCIHHRNPVLRLPLRPLEDVSFAHGQQKGVQYNEHVNSTNGFGIWGSHPACSRSQNAAARQRTAEKKSKAL